MPKVSQQRYYTSHSIFKKVTQAVLACMMPLCVAGCDINSTTADEQLTQDVEKKLSAMPERKRLRYFAETGANGALKKFNVTGSGVRVTMMGEIVDVSHPDLIARVNKQYDAYSTKDQIQPGPGNRSQYLDQLQNGDGHGTHIAGTIAAQCDGKGLQGIACEATIDVYDLGMGSPKPKVLKGWGDTDDIEQLLLSWAGALRDIEKRGASKIVTGSFNLEAPAIKYTSDKPIPFEALGAAFEELEGKKLNPKQSVDFLFNKFPGKLANPSDRAFLARVAKTYNEDSSTFSAVLLPNTKAWKTLAKAVASFQKSGGVYIITESNNVFEDRSSILNALPSLTPDVDKDLWISAVMAVPKDIEKKESGADLTEGSRGPQTTPLNTCGMVAQDYCILVPSYAVLSTITDQVAEKGIPIFSLDNRKFQAFSGHSMGAPMIAAALALMEEHNRKNNLGYTMKDIVRILKKTADRSFSGYNTSKHGRGILDIKAALTAM